MKEINGKRVYTETDKTIINPLSGRTILVGGNVWKKLLRQGVIPGRYKMPNELYELKPSDDADEIIADLNKHLPKHLHAVRMNGKRKNILVSKRRPSKMVMDLYGSDDEADESCVQLKVTRLQPETDCEQPETDYEQPETDYEQPETDYEQPETDCDAEYTEVEYTDEYTEYTAEEEETAQGFQLHSYLSCYCLG